MYILLGTVNNKSRNKLKSKSLTSSRNSRQILHCYGQRSLLTSGRLAAGARKTKFSKRYQRKAYGGSTYDYEYESRG